MIESVKRILQVSRKAYIRLKQNDPLILAAATAFFKTFSLSPIIIIIVSILNLYFKSDTIRQQLFQILQRTLGKQTSAEIENIVNNFMSLESGGWITLVGSVFLLFVATTLLSIVRKAIHQLWRLRRKSKVKLKYSIKERGKGLVMLVFTGILFLLSLLLDTATAIFNNYHIIPRIDETLIKITSSLFSIFIVTTWFTILFKVLPEARVHWKVALAGGLVTGLLFSLGKFVLGIFLVEGNLKTIFGASASIALLLLFIFYSSMIMYYGAAFTHAFGESFNNPIHPGKYSDEYEETVIEGED